MRTHELTLLARETGELMTILFTRHSAVLLESVGRAVEVGEPVLLVGETGVGKTASVQFLADQTGR